MTFFAVTASIMAVSILLIYKLCRYFGLELKWISLVLCAIFAFGVNGATILLSPFLTQGHYLRLTALVLVSAALVTLINEYLLKREKRHQVAAAGGPVLTLEEELDPLPEESPVLSASQSETAAQADVMLAATVDTDTAGQPETKPVETKAEAKVASKPEAKAEAKEQLSQRLLDAMKANSLPDEPQPEVAEPAAPAETEAAKAAEIIEPEAAPQADADSAIAVESVAVEPAAADTAAAEATEDMAAASADIDEAATAATEETAEAESDAVEMPMAENLEAPQAEAAAPAEEEPTVQEEPAVPAETAEPPAAPVPAVPEPPAAEPFEEKPAITLEEPDAAEAAVAELSSLDEILDYAYSHKEKEPNAAITAYRAAIDRYPEDSYAPFLIIELAGLYKERASYNEAINLYAESLGMPIIAGDDAMVQEFSKTLRYLGTVQDILSKHHALATPFSKLTPEILAEIEAEFAKRQAK